MCLQILNEDPSSASKGRGHGLGLALPSMGCSLVWMPSMSLCVLPTPANACVLLCKLNSLTEPSFHQALCGDNNPHCTRLTGLTRDHGGHPPAQHLTGPQAESASSCFPLSAFPLHSRGHTCVKETVHACVLSRIRLLSAPWTVAHQASLSMGFFQARILEEVAISSCRGSFQSRDLTHVFCIGRGILYHCTTWEAKGT